MRVLITSDLHIHDFKEFNFPHPLLISNRVRDGLKVLTEVKKACKEYEIDRVFILGDLFHTRGKIDTRLFNLTVERLVSIMKVAPIVYLAGNHDRDVLCGETSALTSVNHPKLTVVDKWLVEEEFGFIASTERTEVLQNYMKKMDGADYVFFHDAVAGARIGNRDLVIDSEAIDPGSFKNFKRVFAGHYHKRQKIGNFMYVGSPLQHNFGDQGDTKKGFTVLDTETEKTTFIPLKFPEFVTCSFNEIEEQNPKNYLRVKIESPAEAEFVKQKFSDRFIRFELVTPDTVDFSDDTDYEEKAIDKSLDIREQMKEYGSTTKADKAVMAIGFDLLKKVQGD